MRLDLELAQQRLAQAELRLRQLHAFAAELSAASSLSVVAKVVLDAGVGAIGADIAAVWKIDGQIATNIAQAATAENVNRVETVSLDVPAPLTLAARVGEPVFVETRAEYAARFAVTEAMTRNWSIGAKAYACLPLVMNGTVLAVMALAFRGERTFDSADREFLILLARHASIAFQRALDQRAQLDNSRRLRKLHEAADALAEARLPAEVAEATVRLGAEAVNALSGALWLEQDGMLVMRARHNVPESEVAQWERVSASADLPLCRVFRSGKIAWVSSEDDYAREAPEALEEVRASNRGWGYVAMPLSDGQKAVGVLSFSYAGDHGFLEDERRFLQALARTCEHALDRSRLFAAVAESSFNKDEFIAMLSHELRNPLAAMVTAMELIKMKEPKLNREHSALDRQLRHLVHMVGDLVPDFETADPF